MQGVDTVKIPFSVYDFFGYLASGTLICIAVEQLVGESWILRDSLPLHHLGLWIGAAYVVGHLNAGFAAFFLERQIVGKILGRPNKTLFGRGPRRWFVVMFPAYYTPLSDGVQARIRERAATNGITEPGEALFHHVRTLAKRDKPTMIRVDAFLQLYGFCRNICFALILAGVGLIAHALLAEAPLHGAGWYALVALAVGLGMFYRYLKFYRHYSYELFNTYPDLPAA